MYLKSLSPSVCPLGHSQALCRCCVHGLHPGVRTGWFTQPESCLTPVVGAREGGFSERDASVSVICSLHQSAHGGVRLMMSPPLGSPPAPHRDSSDTLRRSVACLRPEIQAYSEPPGVVWAAVLSVCHRHNRGSFLPLRHVAVLPTLFPSHSTWECQVRLRVGALRRNVITR